MRHDTKFVTAMNLGFLKRFSLRQKIMTALAVLFPICSILLAREAGFGAGGILFLSVIVGTLVFVAAAGRDRCFFTGLFTSLHFSICFVWAVAKLDAGEGLFESDLPLIFSQWFLYFVICPTAFAWIVTRFSKHETPNP